MKDERFYELTTKFLSREISEKEKNELSIILQVEQYNREFEAALNNWNNLKRETNEFDVNLGLENLTNRLKSNDNLFDWSDAPVEKRRTFFTPYLLKIAATILIMLSVAGGYYFLSIRSVSDENKTQWNEKTTALGERAIITLFDGSTITLNADTKLKYPTYFSGKAREVFINGEAYFEIKHDTSRPFIVHSGQISTTVLGTTFNVSAFPSEKNIIVSLIEGSVKVSKESPEAVEGIALLQPKQQLLYNKEESISSFHNFESQEVIGWKDNILIFKKEIFSNVLIKLERVYGIKFEVTDKSFYNRKITANFQNESFTTVCETIKKLTGLKYKLLKENNRVKKISFYK